MAEKLGVKKVGDKESEKEARKARFTIEDAPAGSRKPKTAAAGLQPGETVARYLQPRLSFET